MRVEMPGPGGIGGGETQGRESGTRSSLDVCVRKLSNGKQQRPISPLYCRELVLALISFWPLGQIDG